MSNEDQAPRSIMGKTAYTHPDRFDIAPGLHGANVEDQESDQLPDTSKVDTPEPVGHDWEKRYKDMQSYQMRQENDLKREIARLESNTAPQFVVPKTAEELEAFKGENPDLYAVVQSIAHGISNTQMESVNGEVTAMRSKLEEASRENAIAELERVHSDYETINKSPEFNAWLDKQPADVQNWVIGNHSDAVLLIRALSLFKHDTGWGKEASTSNQNNDSQRLKQTPDMDISPTGGDPDQGSDPRKHPKYVWSEAEIQKMRGDEYAHYQADIDLALTEGRVAP